MIAVIDYRAGNLTSVKLALESLGAKARVTDSADVIRSAERVIFPGVGAARSAMHSLEHLGLADVIREVVRKHTPFLGICLGTQIIFEHSSEDNGVEGLGLIGGAVRRFEPAHPTDKIPHMGWNGVSQARPHPVFDGIEDNSEFYFVHSFYPVPRDAGCVVGRTEYAGVTFASVVAVQNLVATQFHPEKSGRIGLQLLKNFVAWNGADILPHSAGGTARC